MDDSLKRAKPAGGARRGGGEELALTQPDSSVMSRIALASVRHNPRSAGPAGLRGFQCGEMQPGEFSEQLKRAFGIRLTPAELDEAVEHFDADGGGTIDGAEFLVHFFQMGFAEKAAQKRARDARGRALREEQLELARSKEQKAQSFLDAQVDWDFKPSDKRSALRKLTAASLAPRAETAAPRLRARRRVRDAEERFFASREILFAVSSRRERPRRRRRRVASSRVRRRGLHRHCIGFVRRSRNRDRVDGLAYVLDRRSNDDGRNRARRFRVRRFRGVPSALLFADGAG